MIFIAFTLEAPVAPVPDSSDKVAIAALIIAILSAGFSGWQAWLNASRRRQEKTIVLFLSHETAQANKVVWKLQNTGGSACKVAGITATLHKQPPPKHVWSGDTKNVIGSNGEAIITWERQLPGFDTKSSDTGELMWNNFEVTAMVARSGSKKFRQVKILPARQPRD